jgi:hypothetical protein
MPFAEETIFFPLALRKRWVEGNLAQEWFETHPDLFDSEDLRITECQEDYHFYEWFGAIHYYYRGYDVLVEQYIYKPHKRKLEEVETLLGAVGLARLQSLVKSLHCQPPDLFVYKRASKEFFLVDVKSKRDKLRDNQLTAFSEIAREFETEVRILRVLPRTKASR